MDTVVLATTARRLLLLHDDAIHRGHVAAAGAPSPRPAAADPPQSASFPKLLPVFILFVLLLCFLSIFLLRDLLHFFSLWLRRRRRLRDAERAAAAAAGHDAAPDAPQKPAGLDLAVLATFPTARFQEDPAAACSASSAPECAVCLSEFAAGDAVRLLTACRHAFHVPCIDAWLAAHTTCPVCRCELAAPPPPRAPGHATAVLRHHDHDGGGGGNGRVAIVVDDNGAGAALATRDSGGARSQFDR